MLRARDLGVSLVALTAAFLALQGTPDVDIQLRWMVGERPLSTGGANLPVPLPLVTDLDGDGNNEVVVLADGGMTVRVLSIPQASGETLVEPITLHEAMLAPSLRLPREGRAVAMAAGYLEPPTVAATANNANARRLSTSAGAGATSGQQQQQRLVVVREDWSVVCFDHELNKLWEVELRHQSLGENFGKTYVIDQVAITVTHSVRKLDDRGVPKGGVPKGGVPKGGVPKGGAVEGLVVVGASMRHRDGRFHHSRGGQNHDPSKSDAAADGVEDPLGVHVEAFVGREEDSRDSVEEAGMTQNDRDRRAAEHFSLFALDGDSGDVRWQHLAGIPDPDADKQKHGDGDGDEEHDTEKTTLTNLDPTLDLSGFGFVGDNVFHDGTVPGADFEGLAAVAGSAGGGGGRQYRRSLLSHLPHAWSAPSDTRLEITALRRRSPGGGGGGGDNGKARSGSGAGRDRGRRVSESGPGGPGGVAAAGGGGAVRVVLARTREGLEAVELSTGRPLSAVALPAAGSGAGVYADLNGDGVVDHVQAVGTRGDQGWGHLQSGVAMGHLSEDASPTQARQARRLPPCYALAMSGLPAREQLFNTSLCHDAGALTDIQERLNKQPSKKSSRSRDVEVGAASPAVLRRGPPGAAPAAATAAAGARQRGGMGTGGVGTLERNAAGLGVRSDVVFAVSSGVVSSYDDEGRLWWQDRRGPKWLRNGRQGEDTANSMGGYVVPLTLEVDKPGRRGGGGGGEASSIHPAHGEEERILVVGKDKMCVYSRRGRLMGSTPLISGPSQRPVVGDFDGDGMADVLIVGRGGAVWGYALSPDPGVRVLFVAVLALAAAMLLVAAVHVPPPPSASLLSSRSGGHGSARRRERGGRGVPVGRKSKRATD